MSREQELGLGEASIDATNERKEETTSFFFPFLPSFKMVGHLLLGELVRKV